MRPTLRRLMVICCSLVLLLRMAGSTPRLQAQGTRIVVNGDTVPDRARLAMPHYRQTDPAWAALELRPGRTMGEIGCAVASLSMLGHVFGIEQNPEELARDLGSWAAPLEWEVFATRHDLRLVRVDNLLDINARVADRIWVRDAAVRALAQGNPVIVGIQHNEHLTTHFIVAYAYRFEDGDYIVDTYDPSTNNDYQTLDDIDPAWEYIRFLEVEQAKRETP